MTSHHHARCIQRRIRLAERRDDPIAAPLGWPQVNEQHLVLAVVNLVAESRPALGQVGRRELALEDRVLQVVAEIPHGLKDLTEPLVVGDVVADENRISHGGSPVGGAGL